MSKVVVGVCGGIAAMKVTQVVSRLVQESHEVHVVLTHGAAQFVGPATFAALCGRPPAQNSYDERFPLGAHIELAEKADLLVIAPATARILASCANGLADDLLATLYLAVECPVLVAPAMNTAMWESPAVTRNVEQLRADGTQFLGPETGWLSCRRRGAGRMSEPEQLLDAIRSQLHNSASESAS